MKTIRSYLLALLLGSLLVFAGCAKESAPLPVGEQTLKGKLVRAEFSLHRRGTHVLLQQDQPLYYVESQSVTLDRYEGQILELQGKLEQNTEVGALPVLVVDHVKGDDGMKRTWNIPSLGIGFSVPASWRGSIQNTSATFTQSGSSTVMLRVSLEDEDALPFNFRSLTPSSTPLSLQPLVIGTRKAVSVTRPEQQSHTVYVDFDLPSAPKPRVLIFRFLLSADDADTALEKQMAIVRSLTIALSSSSSSKKTGSASSQVGSSQQATGKPCGGPAGILCPSGYYCRVTDTATDIGVCTAL